MAVNADERAQTLVIRGAETQEKREEKRRGDRQTIIGVDLMTAPATASSQFDGHVHYNCNLHFQSKLPK